MENLTKEQANFKLSMMNELLQILNKKSEQLNTIIANPKSFDHDYIFNAKQTLTKISFYKAILSCNDVDEFFDLTSGQPNIIEFVKESA